MKFNNDLVQEIGQLIVKSDDVKDDLWEMLTVVYDVSAGHTANSGFLYYQDKIIPICAGVDEDPLILDDTIELLRQDIYQNSGHNFKQLLIQMESETNRIKIDFEFDDASRWSIKPAKIREMRETLRPNFD